MQVGTLRAGAPLPGWARCLLWRGNSPARRDLAMPHRRARRDTGGLCFQVFAGKKGKTSFRANPAQKQMMQQMMVRPG